MPIVIGRSRVIDGASPAGSAPVRGCPESGPPENETNRRDRAIGGAATIGGAACTASGGAAWIPCLPGPVTSLRHEAPRGRAWNVTDAHDDRRWQRNVVYGTTLPPRQRPARRGGGGPANSIVRCVPGWTQACIGTGPERPTGACGSRGIGTKNVRFGSRSTTGTISSRGACLPPARAKSASEGSATGMACPPIRTGDCDSAAGCSGGAASAWAGNAGNRASTEFRVRRRPTGCHRVVPTERERHARGAERMTLGPSGISGQPMGNPPSRHRAGGSPRRAFPAPGLASR